MSPRLSALEEKMEIQTGTMDLMDMQEEGKKATEFVIGTDPEVESEKGSVEEDVLRLRKKERRRELQRRA